MIAVYVKSTLIHKSKVQQSHKNDSSIIFFFIPNKCKFKILFSSIIFSFLQNHNLSTYNFCLCDHLLFIDCGVLYSHVIAFSKCWNAHLTINLNRFFFICRRQQYWRDNIVICALFTLFQVSKLSNYISTVCMKLQLNISAECTN